MRPHVIERVKLQFGETGMTSSTVAHRAIGRLVRRSAENEAFNNRMDGLVKDAVEIAQAGNWSYEYSFQSEPYTYRGTDFIDLGSEAAVALREDFNGSSVREVKGVVTLVYREEIEGGTRHRTLAEFIPYPGHGVTGEVIIPSLEQPATLQEMAALEELLIWIIQNQTQPAQT